MGPRVQLLKIEFHQAGGANVFYRGSDGYNIPSDTPSVAVTFQVNENRDGIHSQFTIVLTQQFQSCDDLVDEAYRHLAQRLDGFSDTAKALHEHEKRLEQAKAERQTQ